MTPFWVSVSSERGLANWPGDAADFHHRQRARKGQHDGHLQDDAEGVADVVGMEFGEAFRAVAALKQESLAFGHLAERGHQVAGLAREHERRIGLQPRLDGRERGSVRIVRNLLDRSRPPSAGRPIL